MLTRFVLILYIVASSASATNRSNIHDEVAIPSASVSSRDYSHAIGIYHSVRRDTFPNHIHIVSKAKRIVDTAKEIATASTPILPKRHSKRRIVENAIRQDGPGVVPEEDLEKVKLTCPFGIQRGDGAKNILFVHGTDGQGEVIWAGGLPDAFHAKGYSSCWVDLPDRSLGDAQITSEYVVHSIKKLYHESEDTPVLLIGHSQGCLNIQWGLNFFPSIRPMVGNFVSLSGDFHGSSLIQYVVATQKVIRGGTAPSYIQQSATTKSTSKFLEALHQHGDIAFVPTTSTYGIHDQIVHDIHSSTTLGPGGDGFTHVAIQKICPRAFVDHFMTVIHRVSFYLALDAFEHGTAANVTRVKANYPDICAENLPPNVSNHAMAGSIAPILQAVSSLLFAAPVPVQLRTKVEPALVPYAANQPRTRRLPRNA